MLKCSIQCGFHSIADSKTILLAQNPVPIRTLHPIPSTSDSTHFGTQYRRAPGLEISVDVQVCSWLTYGMRPPKLNLSEPRTSGFGGFGTRAAAASRLPRWGRKPRVVRRHTLRQLVLLQGAGKQLNKLGWRAAPSELQTYLFASWAMPG